LREDIFPGNTEMARRMRELDWSNTPLGPVDEWPASLRSTVSTSLDCAFPIVLWFGPELTILYNDEYRPMLGPKHPTALGEPGAKVWAEIWDIIRPMLAQVVERGEATRSRDLLLHIDRGYLEEAYFSFSYSPIHADGGKVDGVFCPVIETTEKVIGERRLRTLRDLAAKCKGAGSEDAVYAAASSILEANPRDVPFALIYRVDEHRSTVRLTAAAGIAKGSPASPESMLLSDREPDPWSLAVVAQSGQPVTLTNVGERFEVLPTGAWKVVPHTALVLPVSMPGSEQPRAILIVAVSPMRALDEDYRTFFTLIASQIASALADAEALEDERRRATALAELDRAKTAFFSNVSHEFRTPLTLMIGPLHDLIASPSGLSEEAAASVEIAHRNGLRLLRLVNSMLDFSRIEAGRIDANYRPSDLAALTADLASVFRSAIEKAGLELIVECEPLPEQVHVDRDMWEKIVLNLLSNAFKFTFDGTIAVRLHSHGDRVELQVEDSGVGIPAADLPRVFERFHRVKDARARTHEGTGIGLALVQELVRLHGGTVGVTSEEGKGTTFTVEIRTGTSHLPPERIDVERQVTGTRVGAAPFVEEALRWLPRSGESAAPPSDFDSSTPFSPVNAAHATRRVLIADDNADMRDYLCHILGPIYQVDAAVDGRAALEQIRANPPDLVLTDVMMPKLDGFGLIAAIRADQRLRALPVVLLSARAGEESRIEGLTAGADDYLVKPFSGRELLASISSQLQLAQLRRDSEKALRENLSVTETLNRVGAIVASDLDQTKVVQAVTDAATELTTAECGAFFYNVIDENGESYTLYTISGVPREAFSNFPMPRKTEVFAPTFNGTAVVRSDDLTNDPRYGHNAPYHGMPPGHLPVRSHLAVPVKGRDGTVLGGLFFGHSEVGRFTEHHERLAVGIASWASVALENARLYMSVQEASRIKDDFLASLSHELRTPLNAILGYARMLRSGIVAPDRQQKAVDTIERNATSLTQIVEDVLDISRIVSGKIRLNVQALDFPEIVRSAIDAIAPAAEAKGIRIDTVLDPTAAPISGDPERLQQVLWNLLSNAVKFTNRGGKVQVRLARIDSHVEVAVSDTGAGIAPEFLPHVFERFRQADAGIARERGGLGLGLSIARQLTEMHGGAIDASSGGVGRGATFRLKLPLMIVHPVPDELPRTAGPRDTTDRRISVGDLQGVHVLAVDDERDALAMLSDVLEAAGAQMTTAHSVDEALATLEDHVPDVIVADLGMPQQDGFQFIERVRRHGNPGIRNVPVAALTAYARSDDRVKALRAGFNIHLAKPIDPAELVTTIAALARRFAASAPADETHV
jgi:signal transduction histidine kinase/DNA-binding response OmpR family regulator